MPVQYPFPRALRLSRSHTHCRPYICKYVLRMYQAAQTCQGPRALFRHLSLGLHRTRYISLQHLPTLARPSRWFLPLTSAICQFLVRLDMAVFPKPEQARFDLQFQLLSQRRRVLKRTVLYVHTRSPVVHAVASVVASG